MKNFLKSLIPPILIRFIEKAMYNKYGWKGDFSSWENALKVSTGYDDNNILETVRSSLLKVKNGEAVYERDSVLFDKIQYSLPLLSGLMLSAIKTGNLSVIDFGGSLGSTYFQNKKFLDKIKNVSWNIVEQKHFVDIGKKDFEDKKLKFFYNIKDCFKKEKPNMLLLLSVIQYIEKPYKLLDDLLKHDFEYVLIDRTQFSLNNIDRITLQIVPEKIYKASYPCWIFNEEFLTKYFKSKGYEIIEEFSTLGGETNEYKFKCILLNKIKNV